MDAEEQQIQEKEAQKKCGIRSVFGVHNQARLISIVLGIFSIIILVAFWHQQLKLYSFQQSILYISIGCLGSLIIGAFATIPALYAPAVYTMRFAMVVSILMNTWMIVENTGKLDIYASDTKLRSKSSMIFYTNQNFLFLSRCFILGVQAWICLLIFGCLQIVAKDYHRLRSAKASRGFWFGRRIRRFVTLDSLRFNRPKSPVFEMDPTGKVVEAKLDEFGQELSDPDAVQVISSQDPIADNKETEDQQQLKMTPNQQPPPKIQQQSKLSINNKTPLQMLQDQVAKVDHDHQESPPPQPQIVPDQQMGPLKTPTGENIQCNEQQPEKTQFRYDTFAC